MNASRRLAVLLAAGLGVAATGCGDKESLVIVSLLASDGSPTSATITVGKHSETFTLQAGALASTVNLGLYVPSSITGAQTVTAVATPATGGGCLAGSSSITIASAGAKVGPIDVYLYPTTTGCGGTVATGGITSCSEYDHADSGQCAM